MKVQQKQTLMIKSLLILVDILLMIVVTTLWYEYHFTTFIVLPILTSISVALLISIWEYFHRTAFVRSILDEYKFAETLGLEEVYALYKDCYSEIYAAIERENTIKICVSHGHDFTSNRQSMFESFFKRPNTKLVLLIMNPRGKFADEFAKRFGLTPARFRGRVNATVRMLYEASLSNASGDKLGNLEVFIHDAPQSYACYMVGEKVFFCPYYIGDAGSSAPAIRLGQLAGNTKSFCDLVCNDLNAVASGGTRILNVERGAVTMQNEQMLNSLGLEIFQSVRISGLEHASDKGDKSNASTDHQSA